MSQLKDIERRHGYDRWRHVGFVAVAVVLIGLSIGSVTSKMVGRAPDRVWSVQVIEGNPEIQSTNPEIQQSPADLKR